MKNLSILFFTFFSISLFSCKDQPKESEPEVVTVDTTADSQKVYEVAQIDAVFKNPKIETAFKQYLKVESALVNTDAEGTAKEAQGLESVLKEIEADEATQKAAIAIASSNDIKIQRENFEHLSSGIEKILEGSLESGTLYKQYCPMAFNNRGASWISSGKNILNPYFGDKMLKCGRVEAEIQ